MKNDTPFDASTAGDQLTTFEAARMLGMAVRSVQLMVDRGELQAWKTPGGHRRISRDSVAQWLRSRSGGTHPGPGARASNAHAQEPFTPAGRTAQETGERKAQASGAVKILLIEDSIHFQNLVSLLIKQHFPDWQLHIANDGIAGLAMYGQIQPDILIVDLLLPGIDGGALIMTLRSHPQFTHSSLVVVTSLDESQRAPYAFALDGVDVIHKPRLVTELPLLLARGLDASAAVALHP
ncbi:excisionase [Acidovorax sp. Leaf76]|uniref:helix-turn-helix domain-containing protein n=1 Tax=unclassified Acidovorax TaxID=2684926 RepID=UPI0006FE7F9E|nr:MULTISPECIES: helix-turn-helix domain-containing protein [unclassified Acidovorax]KQO16132.1 excisionase [Acidovorax sp. Leaf76]KQO32204.1 excisionase [Acidovorax sp. Leaf84]KQS31765.1 excisionase [Acidovorax sp. Leaf191]